jgi:hypothetical protein
MVEEMVNEVNSAIWGAHASRVLAMAPPPSRSFPFQTIAAGAPQ